MRVCLPACLFAPVATPGGGADGKPEPRAEEVGVPDGGADPVADPRVPLHAGKPDAERPEQLQHAGGFGGADGVVQAR